MLEGWLFVCRARGCTPNWRMSLLFSSVCQSLRDIVLDRRNRVTPQCDDNIVNKTEFFLFLVQLSELARLLHTCPARFGKSPLNLSVWQHLNLILGLADRGLHTPTTSQSAFPLTRTFVARLLSQWKRMQILLQGPRSPLQCYPMLYSAVQN